MSETISIREAARRLGVSDTAVHKAKRDGRVSFVADANGKPRALWPEIRDQWQRNSSTLHRTHVGPTGKSPRRAAYGGNGPAASPLPTREEALAGDAGEDVPAAAAGPASGASGPSLAQSRAVREAYSARLAKLEYEKAIGKVVEADAVKTQAFKVARSVRDALLNIPDRVASELAAEADPARVHARLSGEIREVLQALAGAAP